MSFTVNYKKAKTMQTEYMQEGNHNATIKRVSFRTIERDEQLENGELIQVTYNHINILLENTKGEVVWDTIWQNIDDSGSYLVYDEFRLNLYSVAVRIPDGTHFNTIEEWMEFILNRQVNIDIKEKKKVGADGKEYTNMRVTFIKEYQKPQNELEKGLAF